MNKLCVLLMLMWLNDSHVTSSVIPTGCESRGPLLTVDGQSIDLHEIKGSWLQMVLVFSRDDHRTSAHIDNQTNIPGLTTTTIVTTTAQPAVVNTTLPTVATITPAQSAVATTTIALPTSNETCTADFVQVGDHCYHFSSTTATFDDASKVCQILGAALAHPKSSLDNSQLTDYFRENNKTGSWWIGATDDYKEGRWVWAHDKSPVGYTDWLGGEPNNAYENEHCAQLRKDVNYEWNDAPCDNKYNYVCQYVDLTDDSGDVNLEENIPSVTTTTAATIQASKSDFIQLGEHSYYFSTIKATFDQASKACQSIETVLAHPKNSQDNSRLIEYLGNKYKEDYKGWWIGATDRDNEGQWVWTHDKSPVVYTDWSSGEPNDGHENEHCAHYRRNKDHKWNDVPCNNKYQYICQSEIFDFDIQDLTSDEMES